MKGKVKCHNCEKIRHNCIAGYCKKCFADDIFRFNNHKYDHPSNIQNFHKLLRYINIDINLIEEFHNIEKRYIADQNKKIKELEQELILEKQGIKIEHTIEGNTIFYQDNNT